MSKMFLVTDSVRNNKTVLEDDLRDVKGIIHDMIRERFKVMEISHGDTLTPVTFEVRRQANSQGLADKLNAENMEG